MIFRRNSTTSPAVLDQIATQSANMVAPKVENLNSQIDHLRMTVNDLPQTLEISRLEDHLSDLTGKLDHLVQQSEKSDAATGPAGAGNRSAMSQQDMGSIERRLDEIARALVAVSNIGNKSPAVDMSAVDRVEARMSELARTIDQIAAKDSGSEFQNLATRIDGLTDRLGSFEKYAESGDLGAASAMFAAPDTGVIEDQLRNLNARIEEAAGSNLTKGLEGQIAQLAQRIEEAVIFSSDSAENEQTRALENQIAQLSMRMEEASHINSTSAQMSNLEAQIGQIMQHLNNQAGLAAIDFSPVENRLGQIEQHLVNNQGFSLEAAQQVAQQAIEMMGPQSESGPVIEALSHDLKALQEVAEGGNNQNVHQLQQMLEQVVERLGSIEGAIEQAAIRQVDSARQSAPLMQAAVTLGEEIPASNVDLAGHGQASGHGVNEAAEDGGLGVIHKAAVDAGYTGQPAGAPSPRMGGFVDAPSIDPSNDIEQALPSSPEDNMPLEPGSGTPDIDNLMKQASAQLAQTRAGIDHPPVQTPEIHDGALSPDDNIRPDAVAAARRALQATTAEMNTVRGETVREGKSGGADGLKGKIEKLLPDFDMSKLRKPLVMGAAALLLAIIAFKGIAMFNGGDSNRPVANIEVPAVEMGSTEQAADNMGNTAQSGSAVGEEAVSLNKSGEAGNDPAASVSDNGAQQGQNSVAEVERQPTPGTPVKTVAASPGVTNLDEAPSSTNGEEATIRETPLTNVAYSVPTGAGPTALVDAASSGDPKALFQIGMRYSDGDDVKRNMTESAKWFQRSAESGFAPAQYSIGSLYEKGIGVKRDITKASNWYEKAAIQGNARAMHNLAVIHAMGNPPEVQPNMDKAVTWFQKAAVLGIKDSQFNLGILYGQGMGVPQNLIESYKWFALAAKTGDSDANKKRDEVANAMDPDDLDDARKVVNDWAPATLNESVNRFSAPDEWKGRGSGSKSSATNSSRKLVKKAQVLLNQRGFNVGTPDGVIGPKTKRAILEFQRNAGIPITGKVDKKTLAALDLQT